MRLTICILQVFLLTLATPSVTYAADGQLSYNDLLKLSQSEQLWFGSAHKSLPADDRIDALELAIFGQHHHGTDSARVSAISSVLNPGAANLLMPPQAPKLDNSSSRSPETSNIDSQSAPLPAAGSPPLDSDRTKSMLRQALKLYSQGNMFEAKAAFAQVLKVDPKNPDAYFNLGAIAEAEGNLHVALNDYQKASLLNPADGEIASAVSSVRAKLANASSSPKNPAIKQDEDNGLDNKKWAVLKEKVDNAAVAYKMGKYDQAIELLQNVVKEAPNRADVYYALSQAYKAKGSISEAKSALNQAVAIEPSNQTYKDALLDLNRNVATDGSIKPIAENGYDTIASDNGSGTTIDTNSPPGQITPFTSSGTPVGWQSSGSYSSGYYGTGATGYYPGYAYRNHSGTVNRIQRVAIGSVAGASFGAMLGGGYRGGRVNGALVGGLAGGLFGLLSGH